MNDDDEFPPLKVTDAPETIWLVYGDIERDCTHAECARGGDVSWCEDSQFASDVRYVRADVSDERVRVLREALRPWVDSEGGRLWVWPETALQSALQNSRAALEATK